MAETPAYSVRIEKQLHDEAVQVFEELGLSFATAINMFLREVVATQSLPLQLDLKLRGKTKPDNPTK